MTSIVPYYKYWEHKGHVYGFCMMPNPLATYSPVITQNDKMLYVNIPKNASTWVKRRLESLDWTYGNYIERGFFDNTFLVVLREPIDRWISGIAEYFVQYHPRIRVFTNDMLDIIFDRIALDDHTERQCYFLNDLPVDRAVFFDCTDKLKYNFSDYFTQLRIVNDFDTHEPDYATDVHSPQHYYKSLFADYVYNNPKYLEKLKNYFWPDFQLIEQVNFYEKQ
jgi:hypothetical protein